MVSWRQGGKSLHSYVHFIYQIHCDQTYTTRLNWEEIRGFSNCWYFTREIVWSALLDLPTLLYPICLLQLHDIAILALPCYTQSALTYLFNLTSFTQLCVSCSTIPYLHSQLYALKAAILAWS